MALGAELAARTPVPLPSPKHDAQRSCHPTQPSSSPPASPPMRLLIKEGPQNQQWLCRAALAAQSGGVSATPDPSPWKNPAGRGAQLGGEPVALWFLANRPVPQPAQGNEQLVRESRKKPWLTESSSSAVQAVSLSAFHRSLGMRTFFWVLGCLGLVVCLVFFFLMHKEGNR